MDRKELGELIQTTRVKREISQEELAKSVDITRYTLICIEKGRQNFHVDTLLSICEILSINIEFKVEEFAKQKSEKSRVKSRPEYICDFSKIKSAKEEQPVLPEKRPTRANKRSISKPSKSFW